MKRGLACALLLALLFALPCASAAASGGARLGLMFVGDQRTLSEKYTNPALTWSSSDERVATASNGTIRALSVGRAIITATYGGASACCGVVVLPRSIEIAAGESYALPSGGLEEYAVQDKSVASISDQGVVRAKRAGETLVGVRYGGQTMLIELKVTGGAAVEQSAAAELDCADSASQIVLVDYQSGSSAKLSIHEKQDGIWKELYSCTAYVGSKGIGKAREGDRKTPSGTYNLTQPFGIKADPGAKMSYTQVTKHHYWCGTSGSEYYNQLVDMREVDRGVASNDEYLIRYTGYYNYCMFIDYNASGEAGKGSCIFLHCTGGKTSTGGCIAVPEAVMKKIVQWAEPGAKIVIR